MKIGLIRALVRLLAVALILLSSTTLAASPSWGEFKHQFINSEGRVSDNGNGGISHTEGQGFAMLMAAYYDDPSSFERIWAWTKNNLQVREDKLFAWSWSSTEGVKDLNNASDGDLLIAWSLARAYQKWKTPEYLTASIEISQTIREKLLRQTNKGLIILPGLVGFESAAGTVVNLSYWVFPAIDGLNQIDPSPQWTELKLSGLNLIKEARFGKWNLPPDWLLISNKLSPTTNDRFGYDAVRIPLYLIWGDLSSRDVLKPFKKFWGSFQEAEFIPSWTDLKTNALGTYNASSGFHNVARITLAYPNLQSAQISAPNPSESYYSYMLTLFTQLALEELSK